MSSWLDIFYFSIFGAALLLSVMGVWFTAIIPGLDRFSKRFFLCYFIAFMLCCLSSLLEMIPLYFSISSAAFYAISAVEFLFLSLPLPMLTLYLQHCRGDHLRKSKLLWAVAELWAVYCLLVVSSPLFGGFTIITPDNHYSRGSLYPLVLQMRPHFIYNTLMGIYSLINQYQQKARQVTADFTDYLRKNFKAVASDSTIPFSTEPEHTRAYLTVEQAQYEEMLHGGI